MKYILKNIWDKKKYWFWKDWAKKKSRPVLTAVIHNFNKDLAEMVQEQKQATPWIHCKDRWMAQWSLLIVWCDRFITPRTKCRGRVGRASRVLKTMWDKPARAAASVYDHPSPMQSLSATAHHRSTYITDLWSDLQQLSREALRLMKPGAFLPPQPPILGQISVGSGGMRQ